MTDNKMLYIWSGIQVIFSFPLLSVEASRGLGCFSTNHSERTSHKGTSFIPQLMDHDLGDDLHQRRCLWARTKGIAWRLLGWTAQRPREAENLGGRRGTKAWGFSRFSDNPFSQSSFLLCGQEFWLEDIFIHPTSIWFNCITAMGLRKHEGHKTSVGKHFRFETLKGLRSRQARGSPCGNTHKCHSQMESGGKPTAFSQGCPHKWGQGEIYSSRAA